jgi:hypothetical protein
MRKHSSGTGRGLSRNNLASRNGGFHASKTGRADAPGGV